MDQHPPMIEVHSLAKSYGDKRAIGGISFEVPRGQVLGFLGPNGAGKTTTMKILTCFVAPTAGTARVAGHDVTEQPLGVRRSVGYLPEDTPLYRDMTTLEFLLFAATLRKVAPERRADRMREISAVCGLDDVMGQQVGELSKGYRQRVGLAQAMIHDPPILILDEPTSGLDPNQIVEIRGLIRELGKEKTVILSTHILSEVEATCDRVLIIHEGRLVADGTVAELTGTDRSGRGGTYRIVVQPGAGDPAGPEFYEAVRERLLEVDGVESAIQVDGDRDAVGLSVTGAAQHDLRGALFECVRDGGWTLLELSRATTGSLEDTFRRLTCSETGQTAEGDKPRDGGAEAGSHAPTDSAAGEQTDGGTDEPTDGDTDEPTDGDTDEQADGDGDGDGEPTDGGTDEQADGDGDGEPTDGGTDEHKEKGDA